ncbi:TPA: hypothetical protein HA278_06330 [Candidatus Woesearchaeota archaeon]|nr:hypothetical protein [Candidatus Woesearchaeota archaeon]|tara:strand:- start:1104 stop:1310 length:207 start_codon:yes stop_codon:yes gene_type:complete
MKNRIKINIDFSELESAMSNGERITVKALAEKHGVSPLVVRNTLDDKYNTSIHYKRGRKGGISLNPTN